MNPQTNTPQDGGDELRELLVDLYYKGYHEGKGDIPNSDDIEIGRVEQLIQAREREVRVDEISTLLQAITVPVGSLGIVSGSKIRNYLQDRLEQLDFKPQAGDGEGA